MATIHEENDSSSAKHDYRKEGNYRTINEGANVDVDIDMSQITPKHNCPLRQEYGAVREMLNIAALCFGKFHKQRRHVVAGNDDSSDTSSTDNDSRGDRKIGTPELRVSKLVPP